MVSEIRSPLPPGVLCKILCHNLCCLIQSHYELGIEATFWDEAEDRPAATTIDIAEAYDWI